MKTVWIIGLVAALLNVAAAATTETNDLSGGLQRGLFQEEANHDLAAAIEAYEAVIRSVDRDRKLAATAVFRLGECYRKLGRTNDAVAQYERVLRDFSEQATLVTLSQKNLAELHEGKPRNQVSGAVSVSAEAEEIRRIENLIRNSPDLLNARDSETGLTLVQQAINQGNLALTQYLLEKGADFEAKNPRNALHLAAAKGHKAIVELLLSKKANVNSQDGTGQTALFIAVERGYKTVAEVLLNGGADVSIRDDKGETPFHLAARKGSIPLAELLLQRKADINAVDKAGLTALAKAVYAGQAAVVQFLLERKADPNIGPVPASNQAPRMYRGVPASPQQRPDQSFPLHLAVRQNKPELVDALVKAGADPNQESQAANGQGLSRPLLDAIGPGSSQSGDFATRLASVISTSQAGVEDRKRIVELLLSNKADPNLGSDQETPLTLAIPNQPDIAELLLQYGADPNATNFNGAAPLRLAVSHRQHNLVKGLLEKKADVDASDGTGRTALHYAAEQGDTDTAALLIAAGANVNARDLSGRSPLDIARQQAATFPPPPGLSLPSPPPTLRTIPTRTLRSPTGASSEAAPEMSPNKLVELLRQHGATSSEEKPRLDRIGISRGDNPIPVFIKTTNDWNYFTLLETLAVHYGYLKPPQENLGPPGFREALKFPDLQNVKIARTVQAGTRTDMKVDLLRLGPQVVGHNFCNVDQVLQWGDVIEVPETDHPLNAIWPGLPDDFLEKLAPCLKREVQLTVKGQTTNLVLNIKKGMSAAPSFTLASVLHNSGLLRVSSDLTRVKVRRRDRKSGQSYELILDSSHRHRGADFWLRDGDVIEVPEKS